MAKLDKLMEKKGSKEMSPMYKNAKMSMLKALRDEMSGMMRDDLQGQGMKKVEVQASDKAGLEQGLDKAKELLGAADHSANEDELGQDEEGEHAVDSNSMWGVSPEMEEEAEEGDSMEPEHEGEMDHEALSSEEEAQMRALIARHQKARK